MGLVSNWDDEDRWNDAEIWFEGSIIDPLLPANCTPAEYALEQSTARIVQSGAPIRPLWDADLCPAGLLPWMAWALGVDEWDTGWSDEAKRTSIKESISIHRHKGTVGAIRRALVNAGYGDAEILENFGDNTYGGALGHDGAHNYSAADHWAEYRVRMVRPITISQAAKVRGILAAIAPLRCHLKQLDFQEATFLYNAAIRYDGAASHGAA